MIINKHFSNLAKEFIDVSLVLCDTLDKLIILIDKVVDLIGGIGHVIHEDNELAHILTAEVKCL